MTRSTDAHDDDPRIVPMEIAMRTVTGRAIRLRAAAAARSWRALVSRGGLAAMALMLPTFQSDVFDGAAARAQEKPRDHACVQWDELATETIVHLVRGKDDALVRQVGDAVFRMRRARRTCQLGWAHLACHEYRAIIQRAPESSAAPQHQTLICPPASMADREARDVADRAANVLNAPPGHGALALAHKSCAELFVIYPPIDEALGNTGGDPFAHHVFNREAELVALREASEACLNRTEAVAARQIATTAERDR